MKSEDSVYLDAIKGLEDLLIGLDQECLNDIYNMQGLQGLTYALKAVPKNVYQEVWSYIKQNRSNLKFYFSIPNDI